MINSCRGSECWEFFVMISMQEIAWQRLDELQPSSDEVISRGITGLKLYMVAPFLAWVQPDMILIVLVNVPCVVIVQKDSLPLCRSLKSWISAHQPPMAPRPDLPLKGMPYFTANSCPSWTSVVLLLNCLEVSWLIGWSLFYLLQLLAVFATSSVCCTVLYASQSYRLQHLILTIDFKFEELSWDSRSEICQCWI